MVGSAFSGIAKSDGKIALKDLKPTGYLDLEDLTEGEGCTGNEFQIVILKANGGGEATYSWIHECIEGEWQGEGFWEGPDADTKEFNVGQGLWFYSDFDEASLTSSGEALVDARNIPLRIGNSAISIPLARAVKLTEIKMVGYEMLEDLYAAEGCTGNEFQIVVLKANGGGEATYSWIHECIDEEWQGEGYWEGPEVESKTFEVGDGLWVYSDFDTTDTEDGIYLSFPGLDADE